MRTDVRVFDLHRIFVGDLPWTFTFEIVFRTAFMYLYVMLLIRVIGKRGLRELTLFEYIIIFALGSSVGDPMFYPEIPLLHGIAVVTAIVALQFGLSMIVRTSDRAHAIVYPGRTACLVRDGVIDMEAMRKERLNVMDLHMILRETGIENLGQVKRAFLEPTGEVSVWRNESAEQKAGFSLAPECDSEYRTGISGRAPESADYACMTCGRVKHADAGSILAACECGGKSWIRLAP